MPQILYGFFFLAASHVIVYSEQWILAIGSAIAWIATLAILLIGMCIIHEYSFLRALAMSLVTIIGMLLAVFVLLMVLTLFQDLFNFLSGIVTEYLYRYKG